LADTDAECKGNRETDITYSYHSLFFLVLGFDCWGLMLTATQEKFSLFLTSFSGDGWAKFSKKLKPDVPRTLPGLTAFGKHERARKGGGAQLSSADAL
jgi:hypothetical protein